MVVTQEKSEILTQNVPVLQIERFKFQAPAISMQNFAADRLALLSERSEHGFLTKNTIVYTKYRKY
jgi:hypothetical protein